MERITKQISKELLAVYTAGNFTHDEIASKFQLSYGAVTTFYHHHKWKYQLPKTKRKPRKYKPGAITNENVLEAYSLYKKLKSLEAVGKLFGNISRERVRQVFKKHELEMEPRGSKKKYTSCVNGHALEANEYIRNCSTCKKIRRENKRTKTHCSRGHEFLEKNTYYISDSKGYVIRRCRTCINRINAEYRKRKHK